MTHREFYIMVLNGVINDEVKQKAAENLAYLDSHYTRTTPIQSEHDKLKQSILDTIARQDAPISAREIAELTEMTMIKVNALCRNLILEGKVNVTEIHIRGKGTIRAYSLA